MKSLSIHILLLSALYCASAFRIQYHGTGNAPSNLSPLSPRSEVSTRAALSSSSKLNMLPPMPNPALFVPHEVLETSKSLMHMYENALIDNPITTKATTSGFLATVGDLLAQVSAYQTSSSAEEDDNKPAFEYDLARGLCFLAFGAAYTGVFQHYWFNFLGSHITQWGEALQLWGPSHVSIPVRAVYGLKEWWSYFDVVAAFEDPPSNTAIATAKLAVNQFLMIPAVYMPLFFAVTGSLARLNLEESEERAKNMYIPLLKRNYFYWLPVQFFQFLVVPADYQILFISVASLVWTVILSSLASGQPQQQQEQQQLPPSTMEVNDSVTLEDVEEALLPEAAINLLQEPAFGSTTIGGAFGLLASAANDGLVGGFISNLLGATIGSGVALSTAAGAVVGLLLSSQANAETKDIEFPEKIMSNIPESQLRQQQVPQKSQVSNAYPQAPSLKAEAPTSP